MRWLSDPLANQEHSIRKINKFLIFPKKISGEWRWLELVVIGQIVEKYHNGYGDIKYKWTDLAWVDEKVDNL